MRLNLLLSILVGITSPLFTLNTQAVVLRCVSEVLSNSVGKDKTNSGYGEKIDFSLYEDADTILSLSEGRKAFHFHLGQLLAEKFPEKKVTITDLYWEGGYKKPAKKTVTGNLTRQYLDNSSRKPFPFQDNSFDRIILRHGLCQCFPLGPVCGGFACDNKQAEHFFAEVTRVLNKKKKSARAYLHGQGYFLKPEVIQYWKQIFEKLEKQYKVKVTFHMSMIYEYKPIKKSQLNSITIRPL